MSRQVNVLIITGATPLSPRQLPGSEPRLTSGERTYNFFSNTMPEGVRPDIVVVRNKTLKCERHFDVAKANTMLMLSEPPSVLRFPASYIRQFGIVHSCQVGIRRQNVKYGPAALPWFVGFAMGGDETKFRFSYDDIISSPLPRKTKRISLITSNKCFTRGHVDRLRFTRRLMEAFPGQVDVFGRGFNPIDDKWDALEPYKYAISIENCRADHYWTEKLSDAMLAGCHVIYSGAPNIRSYFPTAPITEIDINDFDHARETIARLLAEDPYDAEADALLQARRDVMDKYNIFRIIANHCDAMDIDTPRGNGVTLRPISPLGNLPNLFNHTFVWPYYRMAANISGLAK